MMIDVKCIVIERTGREWMVLLLELHGETSKRMIDVVKNSGANVVCKI